jgi:hypothetical protein
MPPSGTNGVATLIFLGAGRGGASSTPGEKSMEFDQFLILVSLGAILILAAILGGLI